MTNLFQRGFIIQVNNRRQEKKILLIVFEIVIAMPTNPITSLQIHDFEISF